MNTLSGSEIRKRFLNFFNTHEKYSHVILKSAPLVPQGESAGTDATLFNIAGVQPIIPAILAGEHEKGPRLASVQKCVRTSDIDEVGDKTHATFFEMLGNWSIGDYFKNEAIAMSWELLTNVESGFAIDPKRMFVTIFSGNKSTPEDTEALSAWEAIFSNAGLDPEKRIFKKEKDNWWSAGDTGPCGPSTEMFYDLSGKYSEGLSQAEFEKFEEAQDLVEIWNNVFMQFDKQTDGSLINLPKQNVDTGSGLERLSASLQGKTSIYDTDLFLPIIKKIEDVIALESDDDQMAARIIADHIKTAVFMASDGVVPSNKDRGYIMRRIIRRAIRNQYKLNIHNSNLDVIAPILEIYSEAYPDLLENEETVRSVIRKETEAFSKTLEKGIKEFEKGQRDAFVLFTTYGFPLEMTQELAREIGEEINVEDFQKKMKTHQESSRSGAAQKFKGGLADHDEKTIALHTAQHLLLAALQKHVSSDIKQRGSNITQERLRMDFNYGEKLTPDQKELVTNQINEWIGEDLSIVRRMMPLEDAKKIGAQMEFGAQYPEEVSVYFIEDQNGEVASKEFCGGPHLESLTGMGVFKIKKEESSSAGVRRIKALLIKS